MIQKKIILIMFLYFFKNHQQTNKGYAFVAAEEGYRFLMQINSKQNKGEGERGLLAKLWSGSGDTMVLAKEDRNIQKKLIAAFNKLKEGPLPSLDGVFRAIYNEHLAGKEYTFTQEASNIYDELVNISVKDFNTSNIHLQVITIISFNLFYPIYYT